MLVRQKLNTKSLVEKGQAFKDFESGLSNKVAEKYDGPKNTTSTWTTNKTSHLVALKQSLSKKKKLRDRNYKQLDHIVFRWFLFQRSQNVLIDGVFMRGRHYSM